LPRLIDAINPAISMTGKPPFEAITEMVGDAKIQTASAEDCFDFGDQTHHSQNDSNCLAQQEATSLGPR